MNLIPRNQLFDIDRVFDDFWSPAGFSRKDAVAAPKVDIKENADAFVVTAELPGVNKEDIHVGLDRGVLTIETTSNQENVEEKDGKVIRKERYTGKMMRSFSLGENINEEEIDASFENGLLNLRIPKREPQEAQSRKIEIR